jgi:hypothetical protein
VEGEVVCGVSLLWMYESCVDVEFALFLVLEGMHGRSEKPDRDWYQDVREEVEERPEITTMVVERVEMW